MRTKDMRSRRALQVDHKEKEVATLDIQMFILKTSVFKNYYNYKLSAVKTR